MALRPGSEEYLDSEKYQIKIRDWDAAEAEGRSLAPYLTRLNAIRRAHPALGGGELTWLEAEPSVLAFRRTGGAGGEALTCVVNLGTEPVDIGRYGEPVVSSADLDGSRLPIDTAVWLR
jgi:glycosidase